jgi:hypothetical protein
MKGIAENDVGATGRDFFGRDAFHGPVRTDRHERGRSNLTATKDDASPSGVTTGFQNIKLHEINIASP